MKKPAVLVVAGDGGPGHRVCSLLQELDYPAAHISFTPPLTITKAQLAEAVAVLKEVLAADRQS